MRIAWALLCLPIACGGQATSSGDEDGGEWCTENLGGQGGAETNDLGADGGALSFEYGVAACIDYLTQEHEGLGSLTVAVASEACEQCPATGAECAAAKNCRSGKCSSQRCEPCSEGAYCIAQAIGHLPEVEIACPPLPLSQVDDCPLPAQFCYEDSGCLCDYSAPRSEEHCNGGTEWICQSDGQGCVCGVRP